VSELHPCPECQRHIRKSETICPFCGEGVSLAHLPAHALPRQRMGRAATFAFGASVVGVTTLVACSDGSDDVGNGMAVYGAPAAGTSGAATDGGSGTAIYGGPPAGMPTGGSSSGGTAGDKSDAGSAGATEGGNGGAGGEAGMTPVYGGPPAGAGGQ
jgi:hypothetical protein